MTGETDLRSRMLPHQYVVTGRGIFPESLMGADRADFASRIDELEAGAPWTRRSIKLVANRYPTIAQWESRGWKVSAIEQLARSPQ